MPPLAAAWSVEEVAAWVLTLEDIDDLEAVAAKVRTEEVDGFAMMAYKDRLEVRSELSLPGGEAARLFAAVEQLRAVPAIPAKPAAKGSGTTVYVIRGPGTEIWTHADSLLQNTWMKHGVYKLTQMTEVQEIQNIPMRDRYEAYKAGMREGVVNGNEMLVFHGCGADAIESIAEKGFLKSFQNTAAWQRFGPGFYFALQVGFRVCLSLSLACLLDQFSTSTMPLNLCASRRRPSRTSTRLPRWTVSLSVSTAAR